VQKQDMTVCGSQQRQIDLFEIVALLLAVPPLRQLAGLWVSM